MILEIQVRSRTRGWQQIIIILTFNWDFCDNKRCALYKESQIFSRWTEIAQWRLIQGKTTVLYWHKSKSKRVTSQFEKSSSHRYNRLLVLCERFLSHCTKMYPMALICLSPLSVEYMASLPHVLELSCFPLVPNPILESHEWQSFSLLLTIPILALEFSSWLQRTLNPSLLQLCCKEACEPISFFHVPRPSEVER